MACDASTSTNADCTPQARGWCCTKAPSLTAEEGPQINYWGICQSVLHRASHSILAVSSCWFQSVSWPRPILLRKSSPGHSSSVSYPFFLSPSSTCHSSLGGSVPLGLRFASTVGHRLSGLSVAHHETSRLAHVDVATGLHPNPHFPQMTGIYLFSGAVSPISGPCYGYGPASAIPPTDHQPESLPKSNEPDQTRS